MEFPQKITFLLITLQAMHLIVPKTIQHIFITNTKILKILHFFINIVSNALYCIKSHSGHLHVTHSTSIFTEAKMDKQANVKKKV